MRALLSLVALLLPLTALAQDPGRAQTTAQTIVYDLSLDGQRVGQREVSIRTVPADDLVPYESRIIESYTQLQAQVAGKRVDRVSRISARASEQASSFVAAITDDGTPHEIQGRQLSDGRWVVVAIDWGSKKTWEYRRTEVQLSSMDLLDPVRHQRLLDGDLGLVLVAESGQVVSGQVTDLGEDTARIGGRDVAVHRATWAPGPATLQMAWSMDGWLVEYQVGFMGKTLQATARQVPEATSFGELDIGAAITQGAPVQEEEL